MLVSVHDEQRRVGDDVRRISRLNALDAALVALGSGVLDGRATLTPLPDGASWEERRARVRAQLSELETSQAGVGRIASALGARADELDQIHARLVALAHSEGDPKPLEEAFVAAHGSALAVVRAEVARIRARLTTLSLGLASKWRQLNVLVGVSCLLSVVLSLLLRAHQRVLADQRARRR